MCMQTFPESCINTTHSNKTTLDIKKTQATYHIFTELILGQSLDILTSSKCSQQMVEGDSDILIYLLTRVVSSCKVSFMAVNLSLLDQGCYFFFQAAPHLSSRGWVDPVPDPPLLRKSGITGNWTRGFRFCSQELWPLDHRSLHISKQAYQIKNPLWPNRNKSVSHNKIVSNNRYVQ
jgi:hypothetical protein